MYKYVLSIIPVDWRIFVYQKPRGPGHTLCEWNKRTTAALPPLVFLATLPSSRQLNALLRFAAQIDFKEKSHQPY